MTYPLVQLAPVDRQAQDRPLALQAQKHRFVRQAQQALVVRLDPKIRVHLFRPAGPVPHRGPATLWGLAVLGLPLGLEALLGPLILAHRMLLRQRRQRIGENNCYCYVFCNSAKDGTCKMENEARLL